MQQSWQGYGKSWRKTRVLTSVALSARYHLAKAVAGEKRSGCWAVARVSMLLPFQESSWSEEQDILNTIIIEKLLSICLFILLIMITYQWWLHESRNIPFLLLERSVFSILEYKALPNSLTSVWLLGWPSICHSCQRSYLGWANTNILKVLIKCKYYK